jgi:hypothetical protein
VEVSGGAFMYSWGDGWLPGIDAQIIVWVLAWASRHDEEESEAQKQRGYELSPPSSHTPFFCFIGYHPRMHIEGIFK